MKKQPVNINALGDTTTPTLAAACRDYLYLEHQAQRDSLETHILQHLEQRLQTGESVFVQIEDVYEGDDGDTTVEATVDYRNLPYTAPERVLSSLRHKESSGASTGEFLMGIPIDKRGDAIVDESLTNTHEFPRFILTDIDKSRIDDGVCELTLDVSHGGGGGSDFLYSKPWINPNGDADHVTPGDLFILDPAPDDYTAASAYQTLANDDLNTMTDLFEELLRDSTTTNASTKFANGAVTDVIDWLDRTQRDGFHKPNPRQQEFVTDVEHELTLLQGPPGTGKTSGALAPAILTRLESYTGDGGCRTLVTGPSNKAIDEVMEKVVEIAMTATHSDETSLDFSNTLFLRLSNDPGLNVPTDTHDNVVFTSLRSGPDTNELLNRVKRRITTGLETTTDAHIVVFGTARRTWKLGKHVIDSFAFEETDDEVDPTANVHPDILADNHAMFDVVVGDEASMMTMPDFLTAGALYTRGGNVLVCGDHRQLPPVQQHDWDNEYKPSTSKCVPFLSVLNFTRYLRGTVPEMLDDIQTELLIPPAKAAEIPLHQLTETYRCHTDVAGFLRRWVYENRDELPYTSNQTHEISPAATNSSFIDAVLAGDDPLTVVTYPAGNAQKSNMVEAWLTAKLIQAVPTSESVGVVTPHSAQRGLIRTTLDSDVTAPLVTDGTPVYGDLNASLQDIIDTDTVERFQGDERDVMIVNGTVSDPDFVDSESQFLLNLNRLNVSLSRMKKKCIVIASEAVFNHIPLDTTEYENTVLWKGLAEDAGVTNNENSVWRGDVRNDFQSVPNELELPTELRVHTVTKR